MSVVINYAKSYIKTPSMCRHLLPIYTNVGMCLASQVSRSSANTRMSATPENEQR